LEWNFRVEVMINFMLPEKGEFDMGRVIEGKCTK